MAGSRDRPLSGRPRELPALWDLVEQEAQDRGAYLLILRLRESRKVTVGQLGALRLPSGYYVYVGSAMRNLSSRLARHQRKRKKMRWHVDYLRAAADECLALPIPSSRRLECDLAAALARMMEPGPAGFGSSDCACPTHLFHAPAHPLHSPAFHAFLESFRMPPQLLTRGAVPLDTPERNA